jgi:hypothetical protein
MQAIQAVYVFGGGMTSVFSLSSRARNVVLGLAMLGLALAAPFTAHAQFRTSVQGTVTDSSGAAIPNAKLTLRDKATNYTVVRTTDTSGVYNFNALPADHFTLTAEAPGFGKKVLNDVTLIPEQPNSLDVQLSLGAVDTTVTVDANTEPAIDTETANTGGTISSNDFAHMPSFNRDPTTLTQLIPGLFSDGAQGSGGGVHQPPGVGSQANGSTAGGAAPTENGPPVFAGGNQMENNSISIDGISTSSAVWGGSTVITPDVDSVDNVRVVGNGYDAEWGRFSGAQTLITSKGGTNQLHGSAFINIHRPGLNAFQHSITSFSGTTNPLRDTARFNQYGASLGGPIWKDKVFAFFAFESAPQDTTTISNLWYETPQFDALATPGTIASTYTTFPGSPIVQQGIVTNNTCATLGLAATACQSTGGGTLNVGSPLPAGTPRGAQDPSATINTSNPGVGGGLTTTPDIAQYIVAVPYSSYYRNFNGRIDANLSKNDRVAFAIYWVPQGDVTYNGSPRAYNLFHHDQINDAFSVIWNHTFSPNFLNEARANAAGWRWNELTENPQQPVGLPLDTISAIGNGAAMTFGAPTGQHLNQWTYGYKDVATKIIGGHTIKFGGDLTALHYLSAPVGRPNYNFYNLWDFLNDAPYSENGDFNPTTGVPQGTRQDFRQYIFGAFVQDDWKARPNLTLHAGVRYSYFPSLYTKQNNIAVPQLGTGSAYLTGANIRVGGDLWNPQKLNFGPQVAFDWSPSLMHDKMVVRGGFGIAYNQEEIAITANTNANPPTQANYTFSYSSPTNSAPNGGDIVYGVSSSPTSLTGFASNPNTITTYNTANLPVGGNASLTAVGDGHGNLPTQYVEHYSADVEYNFNNWVAASLGYQGSVGRHYIVQYQGNAMALAQGVALNPLVTNLDVYSNGGNTSYNSFIADVKHPFSHQFSAEAQYVWARSMDNSSTPYEEDPYYPASPSYSWGRSDYDVRDSFKVFGLWQPVFFHGSRSWIEKVAGGWSLSGIYTVHTGFGWTPLYTTPDSLYCSNCNYTTLRPKYAGGGGHSTSNHAFEQESNFADYNTAANATTTTTATVNGSPQPVVTSYANKYFSVPNYQAAITGAFPGTNAALPPPPGEGRNSFNGPGYRDVDASITKAFGLPNSRLLGNAAKFEIRADFFNLFNNVNLDTSAIATNITATNFGQDTTQLGSRTITFQGRFSF